uniref:Arp2/3 complex 34 kDa subunit n=1 Tax=Heterorhabditis bacteriophora TaxID=37862 RepID=A0A1I7X1S1_HETBA
MKTSISFFGQLCFRNRLIFPSKKNKKNTCGCIYIYMYIYIQVYLQVRHQSNIAKQAAPLNFRVTIERFQIACLQQSVVQIVLHFHFPFLPLIFVYLTHFVQVYLFVRSKCCSSGTVVYFSIAILNKSKKEDILGKLISLLYFSFSVISADADKIVMENCHHELDEVRPLAQRLFQIFLSPQSMAPYSVLVTEFRNSDLLDIRDSRLSLVQLDVTSDDSILNAYKTLVFSFLSFSCCLQVDKIVGDHGLACVFCFITSKGQLYLKVTYTHYCIKTAIIKIIWLRNYPWLLLIL